MALVEQADGRQQRFRFAHHVRRLRSLRVTFCVAAGAMSHCSGADRGLSPHDCVFGLIVEGFDVVLVSSVAGARLREAVFNSWDKNDPKDAQVILRLLKQGMTQRYCDPLSTQTHDLQELSKTYHHIARARTRLQHLLLTHYLTLYFPGDRALLVERSATSGSSVSCCVSQHPARLQNAQVLRSSAPWSGSSWVAESTSERRSQEIYALATNSIALADSARLCRP